MGLQEMPCRPAGLYMMSLLNVFGELNRRNKIIADTFCKYFIDGSTKEGWKNITDIFKAFNTQKLVSTGATPSKDYRTSDSSPTQFMIGKSTINYMIMWKVAKKKNLFLNDDMMNLLFVDPNADMIDNQGPMRRWSMLITTFETIFELEDSVRMILLSIYMNFKSNIDNNRPETKSPGQLLFYGSKYTHGSLLFKHEILTDDFGQSTVISRPDDSKIRQVEEHDDEFNPDKGSEGEWVPDHLVDIWSYGNESFPSSIEGFVGSMSYSRVGPHIFAQMPWDIIDVLFSDINVIITEDINDIWYINVPEIIFELDLIQEGTFTYKDKSILIGDGREVGAFNTRIKCTMPAQPDNPESWGGGKLGARGGGSATQLDFTTEQLKSVMYYNMARPAISSQNSLEVIVPNCSPTPYQFSHWESIVDFGDPEKFYDWCESKSEEFFKPRFT